MLLHIITTFSSIKTRNMLAKKCRKIEFIVFLFLSIYNLLF